MTNSILKQDDGKDRSELIITDSLRQEALHAISVSKSVIVGKHKATFLIAILLRLPIYLTKEISTLATNSLKIWVNPNFIIDSDRELRVFGLLHEVLHVAYGHWGLGTGRNVLSVLGLPRSKILWLVSRASL